jgi:hypothetical protein
VLAEWHRRVSWHAGDADGCTAPGGGRTRAELDIGGLSRDPIEAPQSGALHMALPHEEQPPLSGCREVHSKRSAFLLSTRLERPRSHTCSPLAGMSPTAQRGASARVQ